MLVPGSRKIAPSLFSTIKRRAFSMRRSRSASVIGTTPGIGPPRPPRCASIWIVDIVAIAAVIPAACKNFLRWITFLPPWWITGYAPVRWMNVLAIIHVHGDVVIGIDAAQQFVDLGIVLLQV